VQIRQTGNGTSNATTFTISAPVDAATVSGMAWTGFAGVTNNSSNQAAVGQIQIVSGETAFSLYTTWAGGAWTASGGKRTGAASITYEI